jgi:hypothetical protein
MFADMLIHLNYMEIWRGSYMKAFEVVFPLTRNLHFAKVMLLPVSCFNLLICCSVPIYLFLMLTQTFHHLLRRENIF